MSEKAKRWKRYSYLGRIKQARNTLLTLAKQDFVNEYLRNHIDNLERDLAALEPKVRRAIKGDQP